MRLTASQSRPADMFTTAAVPGRSPALDVCVASNAAARGDAAQAAFDRKLSHFRDEISELRNQGVHYRPLIWTVDGRPYPGVTRTLQYAAGIAFSRNGQQMSATLQRRKREIKNCSAPERQFCQTLGHGLNGSSPVSLTGPCITGVISPLWTMDFGDHEPCRLRD